MATSPGALAVLPSLICAVTQAVECTAIGTWVGAPADNCIVRALLRRPLRRPRRAKRKWRCRHWESAVVWASAQAPSAMDLEGLLQLTMDLQDMWEDRRTCAARRADRYPYEVRTIALGPQRALSAALQRPHAPHPQGTTSGLRSRALGEARGGGAPRTSSRARPRTQGRRGHPARRASWRTRAPW